MLAAACGSAASSDGDTTEAPAGDDQAAELSDEPVELTLWSWSPEMEQQVRLFEDEHPNITVDVVNVGVGEEQYERLRTVFTAGSGGPDVAHFATANLPEFILRDELVDLAPYGANDLRADYPESAWSLISRGDAVYGYPWDTGPMALLYREDIFEEYGLAVPGTWEEFAEVGRQLKEADPDAYLTYFPGTVGLQWHAMLWQAGARPYQVDGIAVDIDFFQEPALKLYDYWEELLAEEIVAPESAFTTEWYSSLATGRYATWIAASWGPGLLAGSAEDSAGKWRAAPLPQWEAGENLSSHWGGSTLSVLKQSEHPAEAETLVRWLLNDPTPARMFTEVQLLFPTLNSILEDPEWLNQPFEFYGGQAVNEVYAEAETWVETDWQWPPITTFMVQQFESELASSSERADVRGAMERIQEAAIQYASDQGFE